MPYINVSTSVKLEGETKESIRRSLGDLISIIPGKSEEVLMVCFSDASCIFYAGKEKRNAAYVDVKIHGTAAQAEKSALTEQIFAVFKDALNIDNKDMFVTISEFSNWGFQGRFV